jgi:hypothetical protein
MTDVLCARIEQQRRQMRHIKTARASPDEANAAYALPRRLVVVVTVDRHRTCHHRCNCPLPCPLSRHPRCLSSVFQLRSISSSSHFSSARKAQRMHARRVPRRNLQISRKTKKPLRLFHAHALHAAPRTLGTTPTSLSPPTNDLHSVPNQLNLSTSRLHTTHAS